MKLNFRINWGYQYLYTRRHYHPYYHWDGHLECSDGVIEKVFQIDYPVIWFGPGHCAKETLWNSLSGGGGSAATIGSMWRPRPATTTTRFCAAQEA